MIEIYLITIDQVVSIGIRLKRLAVINVDLVTVGQTIAVAVLIY